MFFIGEEYLLLPFILLILTQNYITNKIFKKNLKKVRTLILKII